MFIKKVNVLMIFYTELVLGLLSLLGHIILLGKGDFVKKQVIHFYFFIEVDLRALNVLEHSISP